MRKLYHALLPLIINNVVTLNLENSSMGTRIKWTSRKSILGENEKQASKLYNSIMRWLNEFRLIWEFEDG